MEIETGDIVLCTVEKIEGTTVFVNIEEINKQGCIVLSEIAPGRIRNLRDYVVPKKLIVCKILKITGNTIELSLRRVSQKEQKEAKDKYNQERSYKSILKSVVKERTEEIFERILKKDNLSNFFEKAKENSKELEEIVGKENANKILDILNSQKIKKSILKKEIDFHTTNPNGLEQIKQILEKVKEAEIKYISAGRYSIKIESKDLKKADNKLKEIIENLSKILKENSIILEQK